MLTIDALREVCADAQAGLNRCMNNEGFYLRLVNSALEDASFDRLAAAVEADDRKAAFEAAHAIKGVAGNLGLTPLYQAASEMTELLRAGKDADYPAFLDRILRHRESLLALRDR